jgi:hypothetical protein
MKGIDALRRRLAGIKITFTPAPWPPEPGSYSWCMWTALGEPADRIGYWDMYLAVAEKVWSDFE